MLQDIQKTLWSAADKLRANVDAAEYKHIALGMIFLKFISDSFSARRAELTRRFADENDEYFLHLQRSQRILGTGRGALGSFAGQCETSRYWQAY